ncbi:methionine--tRNA ligase subunit beta, partial [Bacillus sp. SG-1]|uniref:methionine--tRNA ligase subunit beta n=1 Tax=Bacillus sp. SG-1 TaxID=161544 RepID=UPI0001544B92
NDLGNLLNRTVAMINKYFDGEIPMYKGSEGPFDKELLSVNKATVAQYEEAMEKMEFSVALSSLWQLISRTNKYIDETQPWVLAKEEKKDELGNVMVHLAETLRRAAVMLQPFLTRTPKKIFQQLNVDQEELTTWESLEEFGMIPAGTQVVKKGEPIFPRLDIAEEVEYIQEKMRGTAPQPKEEAKEEEAPESEEITIDDFMKVDFRVATVTHAEPVKKADKLLKIQLDLGYEKRQVVSGIAKFYKPEELVGKKVICVTNLKPVKLRGELSQGMILAGEKDGVLSLASVDQALANGAKVK